MKIKTNVNVILYTRVSTDEQADGCSIEMQERYLNAYCNNRGYNIISTYHEDYSAKHYDAETGNQEDIQLLQET